MSALPNDGCYTIQTILSLPDGERAELIDGCLYDMAAPSVIHQRISMGLSRVISNYIADHHGSCSVYAAPFAVFLFGMDDEYNYFEPDISVICDPSKTENGKGCDGPPDWIIEIVSPSTAPVDYVIKLRRYQQAGVREYWIIDPQAEKTIVYVADKDPVVYSFTQPVPSGIYPELSIDVSKL